MLACLLLTCILWVVQKSVKKWIACGVAIERLSNSQMKTYMVNDENGVFNGIYAVFISV